MRFGKAGSFDCVAQLTSAVNKARDGILLVDSAASQLLHWWIGEGEWMCAVNNILDMDSYGVMAKLKSTSDVGHVVFLTGRLLRGDRLQLIQRVLSQLCSRPSSPCSDCSVYCVLPESSHAGIVAGSSGGAGDVPAFSLIANQLKLVMEKANGGKKCTARVLNLPAILAPICGDVFFTPAHANLQALLTSDVPRINSYLRAQNDQRQASALSTLDINMLPSAVRQHLKCVAHNFSELCRSLNVQEHCFSLGPTSRLVASELASMPEARARHKTAASTASVLFIDRSLDLTTPLSCHSDNLADLIGATLDRLPGHDADVAVDMTSLLDVHSSCRHCVAPGCLSHPGSATAESLLSSFMGRKTKDALFDLCHQLVDAIAKEKLPMEARRMSVITPTVLRRLLEKFKCRPSSIARHSALLQIAMAAANAMDSDLSSQLQRILSVEKVMLLTLTEEGFVDALDQLVSHMKASLSSEESIGAAGYLRLLMILYSAAGSDALQCSSSQQSQVQSALEAVVLASCERQEESITSLVGEKYNKDSVCLFVRTVFTQLTGLADARSHLKSFRRLGDPSAGCLLQQVAHALVSPEKPELPDIEYHSQYLRNLIKTGFSLFMGGSKPQPANHPLLIVYVIGGVTCGEIRAFKEQFSLAKSEVQVVVGGSCFPTAASLLKQVCCSDSLNDVHI